MPIELDELDTIKNNIITILSEYSGMAYSSKEISGLLSIAHSTARKYLKILFDERVINRGKQKKYNKTYFYYITKDFMR